METKQHVTDVTAIGHPESFTLTADTPPRDVLQKRAHRQTQWRGQTDT